MLVSKKTFSFLSCIYSLMYFSYTNRHDQAAWDSDRRYLNKRITDDLDIPSAPPLKKRRLSLRGSIRRLKTIRCRKPSGEDTIPILYEDDRDSDDIPLSQLPILIKYPRLRSQPMA